MSESRTNTIPDQVVAWHTPGMDAHTASCAYGAVVWLLALMYGAALAALPVDVFLDRDNYLTYASDSLGILVRNFSGGPISVLANEPLFLLINIGLSSFLSPETVVRSLIFLSATVVARFVLRKDPRQFVWLLFFLLVPQVIKNHIVHLRQGVAIAVFLLGWNIRSVSLRWMLLLMAAFIHASFVFVIGLLMMTKIVQRMRFAADIQMLAFVSAGIVVGLGMGWLAQMVGARQGESYAFDGGAASGLGFVFWLFVLALFVLQGKTFMQRNAFPVSALVLYLATYFLVEVTARIFESSVIFVLLAGLLLTSWRRAAFLTAILFYVCLSYLLRLNQPWLGFAT